ncbi:MAG TPA: SDR family NAD(P)-dependent oxidoreductase [Bryobacteraceae bacterium]|jgi:NAD(P)-dependent dehydrogenase (short-subunit alcohol dehydrogenase family)|nr:SDR family NAD(P)-dependent oxidoreductase [Bryobacteraceae bacterium]
MQSSSEKIALVTGANKGIGFEVARQLAASGCTVLLGARNQTLGEKAAAKLAAEGLDVRYMAIDLTDPATIAAAAKSEVSRVQRLEGRPEYAHRAARVRTPRYRH